MPWEKCDQFVTGALKIHEIHSHHLSLGQPIRYIMPNEHRHSLHWTDGSEMDFPVKDGHAASPYQAFVLSFMQFMGAKQWAMDLYMEAQSSTDPMRLHEILLRHTKYGQPYKLRVRAFLESGKALAVVQKAFVAWIKHSPPLQEALLNTGEDYLLNNGTRHLLGGRTPPSTRGSRTPRRLRWLKLGGYHPDDTTSSFKG